MKPWDTLVISDNLTWEQFSKINLYLHELEGAKPVLSTSRFYPYANDLVHIVGYVGDASPKDLEKPEIKENFVPGLKVGKYGIENSQEKMLIGNYGIKRYEVNASGKRISQIDYIKERQGNKVNLTIDIEIQKYAQELLKGKAGSICAMDIYTGEVVAMASSPTYDPNKFTHGIKQNDWNEIRREEMLKWNSLYGDAMANFKMVDPASGILLPRPIPERRINLDHTFTLVQSLGMYNNTKPGGNMYNRIQRRVLERGYVAGDASGNLELLEPFSHAQKTAFFNKIAGPAGEIWWNGQHRNTGYTRYEWMQGKASRKVDGKSKMTDIWDSKTRRQKHVDGTGAAADAHMEVVEDWLDMIDEGDKIVKSGMNFFKANETDLDPFEVGELLAEVDINDWSVPKLKQLIADAEAKGLGIPLAKKSEQEVNKLAKQINPFIHKQITGKKKDVEKLFRIILSDKTGVQLKKEIAEVESNYGDGIEFYRQLTLAFDSIKPALTPDQEKLYRFQLGKIKSIIFNDPTMGRFNIGTGRYDTYGMGAGGVMDDI